MLIMRNEIIWEVIKILLEIFVVGIVEVTRECYCGGDKMESEESSGSN